MQSRTVDSGHDFSSGDRQSRKGEQRDANSETSSEQPDGTNTAPWRSLFFFTTRANIPIFVAGSIASIISGAASPAQSFLTGRFFEKLIIYATGTIQKDEFIQEETKYIQYLLIVAGVSWISLYAELALWIAFGELQAKSARDRLFYGLLRREIEWFDLRKHGVAALLPRFQTQIRALQLATSQPLGMLAGVGSSAVLSLIQAFVLSWKLTLVTISTTPVILLAVGFAGRRMQEAFDKQNEMLTEAQKFATNAFTNIETVKCFNAQHVEQMRYKASIARAAAWYYRAVHKNALQQGLVVLLSISMFVQGFYYGGILISRGEASPASVITTFMSALAALQAINTALPQMIVFEKGRNAGSVLRAAMAEIQHGPVEQCTKSTLRPSGCQGAIEVKNLTFSYPTRPLQPALQEVSMSIPAGELTFIIGRSGSGKSTLGQLLVRFYTSYHGRILFNGVDLAHLDVDWLRKNITLVEQSSTLFNDTIYQNIALGENENKTTRKEDVDVAVQFALLQTLIFDSPAGMHTVVGDKGSSMSGGQRQRIALARARLRDTPVLILDESTSALDHTSRSLIMDAVRHWRRGKTTIVITHDIAQILPNDYLYVFEHGRIVQTGYRKHLEVVRDTPFRSFLTNTQSSEQSWNNASRDSQVGTASFDGISSHTTHSGEAEILHDPLETRLTRRVSNRTSHLPLMFQDGSPILGLRQGPLSGRSNWMRSRVVPTTEPSVSPGADLSPGWTTIEPLEYFDSNSGRSRMSMALETFLQRAGSRAAESRKTLDGRKRTPPVELDMSDATRSVYRGLDLSNTQCSARITSYSPAQVEAFSDIMSTLWPSIDWCTRLRLVTAFICAAVAAVSTPVFSYFLSKMLKLYSIPGGDRHESLIYALAILAISVLNAIGTYIYHMSFEYVGQHWVDSIRSRAFKRILDQPREFFDKSDNAVTRLADRLDRNAEEMRNLLGRFSASIWMALLMTTISVIWALMTQWKTTLVALAAAPYILGVAKAFGVVSEKWETLSNRSAEDASAVLAETVTSIRTVHALTLEQHFIDKYIGTTNRALTIGFQRAFYTGFFYGICDSADSFTMALMFFVGAKFVSEGIPAGDILEVFVFLIFALGNLNGVLGLIPQIATAKDMASQLVRLANLPKDSHEHRGTTCILGVGDIVFNDVEFSYPSRPEHSILKHLDLHIRAGTCTALVGASGCGKSTVANLLLNLYCIADNVHAKTGSLTIAGRNIKRIETSTLRTRIVTVSQTSTLVPASILENIAYGLPPNSPFNTFSAISAAASKAGIHEFINSLPQGYSTLVGDGGMGISGGQAQRIAIARALVRQPAVLILDEATSALDAESAGLVRHTILDLIRNRGTGPDMTVVVITHSREMMEIADSVVVLEDGRVVEEDSFNVLMSRRGGALMNLLSGGEWFAE